MYVYDIVYPKRCMGSKSSFKQSRQAKQAKHIESKVHPNLGNLGNLGEGEPIKTNYS